MTLRARLGLIAAFLALTIVGSGFAIWRVTRQSAIDQLDRRLETVLPNVLGVIDRSVATGTPAPQPPSPEQVVGAAADGADSPLSDVFVARLGGAGTRIVLVRSVATDLEPSTPAAAWAGTPAAGAAGPMAFSTVGSLDGSMSWRATVVRGRDGGNYLVAISQQSIDTASGRLVATLSVAGTCLFAVLAVAGWWVSRLGLRPITRIAAAARSISAGDRDTRVEEGAPGTEAAELATAFNVMLDEHAASEARLRRFVSDSSHELRTPVAAIRGFTDLYRAGALEAPGQLDDAMRRIGAEGARMAGLVDDLLLLARLDEGRPLASEPVDIAALLHDAALDASATHPSRSLTVDAAGPIVVRGDEHRLRQVVANLVANALVHAPDSAIRLTGSRSADGSVVVQVADTGVGLEPDDAARAFDRFWRADASRRRSGSGSGLGLSIVRAIVEAHGGRASMDSRPGSGTTVTVRLPADPVPPSV